MHVFFFVHEDVGISCVACPHLRTIALACPAIFGHVPWLSAIEAVAPEGTNCGRCSCHIHHIDLSLVSPILISGLSASPNVHRYWDIVHPLQSIGGVILGSIGVIGRLCQVSLEEWSLGSILTKGVLKMSLGSEPRISLVVSCMNGFNQQRCFSHVYCTLFNFLVGTRNRCAQHFSQYPGVQAINEHTDSFFIANCIACESTQIFKLACIGVDVWESHLVCIEFLMCLLLAL